MTARAYPCSAASTTTPTVIAACCAGRRLPSEYGFLVHNDQYLTAEKKTEYNAWLAEQQLHRQAMEAALTHAKTAISDFCEREGLGEPDFPTLRTSTLRTPPPRTASTMSKSMPT